MLVFRHIATLTLFLATSVPARADWRLFEKCVSSHFERALLESPEKAYRLSFGQGTLNDGRWVVEGNGRLTHLSAKRGDFEIRFINGGKKDVGLLADAKVIDGGKTLLLDNISIFVDGAAGNEEKAGYMRHVIAGKGMIEYWAKAMGFSTLEMKGRRILSSSSANPGHGLDWKIDLATGATSRGTPARRDEGR